MHRPNISKRQHGWFWGLCMRLRRDFSPPHPQSIYFSPALTSQRGKRRESSAGRSKCGKDRDTLGVSGASKWAVTSLNRGLCGPHTLWAFLFQPPWRTRVTRLRRLKNSSGDLQPLPATQSFQITLAEDPPGSPIRPRRRPPGPGPSLFLLVSDSAGVPAGTCHRWPRPRPPPAGSPLLQQ